MADTVPGESPSSWATLGGAGPQGMDWGFQELEAQAIAVRSYVLADLGGYGGYADTCDLTCQTYRGTEYETPASIAAANDTAGQVMVMPDGQIATTEYSASTGGYTSSANQESPFTAVPDDGDAVVTSTDCLQPQPQLVDHGQLRGHAERLATDRHVRGSAGRRRRIRAIPTTSAYGRVDTITIEGSAQTITIPGTEFYVDLGLKSDLFTVTSTNGGALSIIGQGWGHGIGMGQWGALGYAIGAGPRRRQLDLPADRGPLLRSGHAGEPARRRQLGRRLERRGRRLLDQRRRRRRLQLRQRAVLRQHGRHACSTNPWSAWPRRTTPTATGRWPATVASSASATRQFHGSTGSIRLNKPMVGHGGDPRRRRVLAGGLRRRHLRLRQCAVLREHRQHRAQQADHRHGADPRRRRLLAHRIRRRRVRLRRRRLLRLAGRRTSVHGARRGGPDPRRRRVLGARRQRDASTPSATRRASRSLARLARARHA